VLLTLGSTTTVEPNVSLPADAASPSGAGDLLLAALPLFEDARFRLVANAQWKSSDSGCALKADIDA